MKIKITTIDGVNLCDISHIEPLDDSDIEKFAKDTLEGEIIEINFEHNQIDWKFGNYVILSAKDSLYMITEDDWEKIQSVGDQIARKNENSVSCYDGCGMDSCEVSV